MKDTKSIFKLGMTAIEVVCKIIEVHPCISSILFKRYIPPKNLEEEDIIQFSVSIDRMLFHSPPETEQTIWLKGEEMTSTHLVQIIERLAEKEAIAVTSNLKLLNTDEKFHIPMIDFNCDISAKNLERIQEFLRKIEQRGVVLESGRSYHYYGIDLLSQKDWLLFLGKCLLFLDHIGSRYIGHRLIDGYTSLRISTSQRRPVLPKVVAVV